MNKSLRFRVIQGLAPAPALGCSVHASGGANAPPPPPPVATVQVSAQESSGTFVQSEPPPPPPPQVEAAPASPGSDYVWIAGYQRWSGHEYTWVGGRYARRPHPGAQWRAAHWEPRGSSRVWVDGAWGGEAGAPPPPSSYSPPPAPVVTTAPSYVPPPGVPAPPGEVVVEGEPPPPPPPPQAENRPAPPGGDYEWIPGYQRYDGQDHRYVWTAGRYERRPHAGAKWRAAHWETRGTRHVWVEGSWA